MISRTFSSAHRLGLIVILTSIFQVSAFGQQVLSRGPFGRPNQVMDETQQWTAPLLIASDHAVDVYIPDVTSPDWLKLNYPDFHDHGFYTISVFTFFRTPKACRAIQIGWGFADKPHLDACIDIGYRIRRAHIDPNEKSATQLMAAMIGLHGDIDPDSVQTEPAYRLWDQLAHSH
jgi:hypothetical protein